MNAAGYVRLDDAQLEQPACYRDNTLGAAFLARACGVQAVPLVTFSTDLVFDGRKQTPYVEDDAPAPLSVYGESKAEAERLVLSAHRDALVVRTSAFFSPWDEYNFATRALAALAAGRPFYAPSDTTVSPTYVPDLVNATLDLLIDGESGMWHLANEGAVTWFEFAARLAEAAKLTTGTLLPATSSEVGWFAPRPTYSVLGSARGWIMPPLDDAITRYTDAVSPQKKTSDGDLAQRAV